MSAQTLLKKINDKSAVIAVIGMGYVGFPLATAFAERKFSVLGIDKNEARLKDIAEGRFGEGAQKSQAKSLITSKKLKLTSSLTGLRQADCVIICVPTPLNRASEPDISAIVEATEAVAKYLKKGQLISLESTTYPGTTEEIMMPILNGAGLKLNMDYFLAFSPERIDPGNRNFHTTNIPKVVSGVGEASQKLAKALYETVVSKVFVVSSTKTAEMAKLLENTFRSVNIALVNEMAVICERLGVDVWEVIEAAKTKPFGFMPFYPGPGTGGHCIPIDPLYLSWKSKLHGYEAKLIDTAARINKQMPYHVVDRVAGLLNMKKVSLKKAKVLLLGITYKKDVKDARESPALDVFEEFIERGATVSYSDPGVPSIKVGAEIYKTQVLTAALLKKQDCVVVLTEHSGVDYSMIADNASLVFDTRNVFRKYKTPHKTIYFL